MTRMRSWITWILCALFGFVTRVVGGGHECYTCVHVPFLEDSEGSCSAAWPWYRDLLGHLLAPPSLPCQHHCMKVVLKNPGGQAPTVVRACSSHCNESATHSSVTSCCLGQLCNHSPTPLAPTRPLLASVLLAWLAKRFVT